MSYLKKNWSLNYASPCDLHIPHTKSQLELRPTRPSTSEHVLIFADELIFLSFQHIILWLWIILLLLPDNLMLTT